MTPLIHQYNVPRVSHQWHTEVTCKSDWDACFRYADIDNHRHSAQARYEDSSSWHCEPSGCLSINVVHAIIVSWNRRLSSSIDVMAEICVVSYICPLLNISFHSTGRGPIIGSHSGPIHATPDPSTEDHSGPSLDPWVGQMPMGGIPLSHVWSRSHGWDSLVPCVGYDPCVGI